jgi:methyl-accepting chemotaxis protein
MPCPPLNTQKDLYVPAGRNRTDNFSILQGNTRSVLKIQGGAMKKKSLRFKMIMGGVLAVVVPLLIVGGFSIYRASSALEEISQSQSREVARGLAAMANLAVQEELRTITQLAVREAVISAAATRGISESTVATDELTRFVQSSGDMYETISLVGLDGKVFADGVNGRHKVWRSAIRAPA